jgi:putative oxidoreductase
MQKMINSWSYRLGHRSIGLLLIRVAVGLVFLAHGWMKVGNIGGVEGMFVGFGLPGATGVFIAWLEVIGGLGLILGILPRLFGLLFGIEMLVAIFLTGGIANGYKPHELEIFLMLVSFGIMFAGSGRYSLWSGECHRCGAYMCKMGPDNCPQMAK